MGRSSDSEKTYILPNSQRLDLLVRYISSYEKIINLETPLEEELKRIKVTSISEHAGKICEVLKDSCPKKLTPRKMTKLTAKNLGEPCRPPDEVNGV